MEIYIATSYCTTPPKIWGFDIMICKQHCSRRRTDTSLRLLCFSWICKIALSTLDPPYLIVFEGCDVGYWTEGGISFFVWDASPFDCCFLRLVAAIGGTKLPFWALRLLRLFGWRCSGGLWTSYTGSTHFGSRCNLEMDALTWLNEEIVSCLSKDIQF